jgi:hypothetical protein
MFAPANASKYKNIILEFLKPIKVNWNPETHTATKSIALEDAVHYVSPAYGSKYPAPTVEDRDASGT